MGERTWVQAAPDPTLPGVLSIRPDLATRYDTMLDELWGCGVDPCLLELCRVALALVLGDGAGAALRTPVAVDAGLDESRLAGLTRWRADPSFTPLERAALGVTEQFAVDVHGVTDAQFAEVASGLGPAGAVALTTALGLFDGQSRMRLAFAARTRREEQP